MNRTSLLSTILLLSCLQVACGGSSSSDSNNSQAQVGNSAIGTYSVKLKAVRVNHNGAEPSSIEGLPLNGVTITVDQ